MVHLHRSRPSGYVFTRQPPQRPGAAEDARVVAVAVVLALLASISETVCVHKRSQ